MADPFAANPQYGSSSGYQHPNPNPNPSRPQQPYRASTGPGQIMSTVTDEFGSYSPGHAPLPGSSQSTSSAAAIAAARNRQSMPMPLPVPEPIASTSHAYASSHSHTAQSQSQSQFQPMPQGQPQSRAANRRSHNPTTTLGNASPPRAEYLTDEYVLHPSVYAYKQAHPRRPMIGFGPYVLLQTLGEGEFGKVKLGVHTDYGVEVAIKLIRRGSLDDEVRASKVEREIDVLKTLKHPNIVRMFDVIDTEKYIGIVLEYAGGGELFEHILANRYLKEKDAQKLFAQLISGVDYLHRKHIVHRDLKLENLLLDKHRNIIITDFGFANRFDHAQDDLMATSCGSPCYAAPELVVSEGLYVGSAVDIWSCGVILYAMLSGYLPYDDDPQNPDGDNINLLYKYIMNTKLNFPDHMSPSAKSLLQIMLVPLPEHRCTISHIMEHPWLEAYRDTFIRSVEEHEYVFQEAMYRKSQQAKRELSERKRIQAEAKEAKAMMQRSQSSVPGTTVTASMLDYQRRREQRHHSALPTTSTMPEYLSNAGHRTPPLEPRHAIPPAPLPQPTHTQLLPEATMVISPASMPPPTMPSLSTPSPSGSLPRHLKTEAPINTPTESIAVDSIMAVENEALATPLVTPPVETDGKARPSMSSNKNRHTIQVEYDGEASYERMQEAMQAKEKGKAVEEADNKMEHLAPQMSDVRHGGTSDVEMESGSSDNEHARPDTVESSQEHTSEASAVLTPPITTSPIPEITEEIVEVPTMPSTPSRKSMVNQPPTSPSTPRASVPIKSDVNLATPRAERAAPPTPKASLQAEHRKRHGSMPPISSSIPAPNTTVPAPRNPDLNASGLPKPPKRDRYRKGMSLDKFGLAKLLGQVSHANDENRAGPPSASASAVNLQSGHAKRGSMSLSRPGTADQEKKSRRKTLQLMVNKSNSRDERVPQTPLTARDMNPQASNPKPTSPPVVIAKEGIKPSASPQPDQSSPSIVTVDAFAAQQTASPPQKTASSKAAKKVMDWFRRKSLAKDTLVGLKSAGIKSDSQSSFVRVSPARPRAGGSTANLAMSSVSSIGLTQEGPVVTVTEDDEAQPESATLPKQSSQAQAPTVALKEPVRMPLGESVNKTNVQSTSDLLSPTTIRVPTPERSKSHRISPSQSGTTQPRPSPLEKSTVANNRPRSGSEDVKMRVHTGLVDQSALSSKPPKEVMNEVLRVLQEMGMEIKRENEFKLRCTRARRRKAGATTALGSVMSVGSGMSPFTLMSSASASRTDSRGLPLPMSPSTGGISSGLKGMLLRRGSSYSSQLPRSDSEIFNSPSIGNTPVLPSTDKLPSQEPLYGEHSVDSGDEVKFVIELCRIKNLPGLYLLNIKRLRGSVWSFKFIYQTVLERTSTLTH